MTGTSGHIRSTHVGIRARHLAADIALSECEVPLKANGPVLINQWICGYMTVYLQDVSYTRLCEGSHRKECEKGSHMFRNVISILWVMGQSLVIFITAIWHRSLQTANISYGHMPCRETKTARVEPTKVISQTLLSCAVVEVSMPAQPFHHS